MVVLFIGNYNYLPKIKQTLHMTCLTAKYLCMYKKFYIHYVFSIKTDTIFPKRSSSSLLHAEKYHTKRPQVYYMGRGRSQGLRGFTSWPGDEEEVAASG